ncbi:IgA peptidase M64-domain-containing protein [Mycena galopus ATCC 62051]|nr:IgA peptidase M64-domain-containing protein [Mycena galopus ATCC 62051]
MLPLSLLGTLALPVALGHDSHRGKCLTEWGEPNEFQLPPFFDEAAQTRLSWSDTKKGEFDGVPVPPLEILPLVVSDPSSNRVDLIFFADGYLQEEKGKFFADAARLAEDISGNQTFNTVKPLMNFWAAFTPSKESGVGVGGKPKDTPFGLYRDGTELRCVYYAHPEVAGAACTSLGDQCDYPILLGNDPLYGGLGGTYTVITPSLANGALILRHELGHSIIPVGEEYDGGYAYFGPNAYHNLTEPVPWAHWLTDPGPAHARVERSVMPMQDYAFVSTPGHYSLYPTFSMENRTTYRPTNDDCLMRRRQVPIPNFCKACLEGLWLALLKDISLIDGIDESCAATTMASSSSTTLTLHLVPLAQFRAAGAVHGMNESYTVTWRDLKDGRVLEKLANKTEVAVGPGRYGVEVKYATSEVRLDREGRLGARMEYIVEGCA